MNFTQKIFLTCAIATTMLSVAFDSRASAGQPVVVHVVGGRQLAAEVDDRTDGERLWLAFRTRSTELRRGLAWNRVVSVNSNGESFSAHEFRETVLSSTGSKVLEEAQKAWPVSPGKQGLTSAEEALDLLFSSAKRQ